MDDMAGRDLPHPAHGVRRIPNPAAICEIFRGACAVRANSGWTATGTAVLLLRARPAPVSLSSPWIPMAGRLEVSDVAEFAQPLFDNLLLGLICLRRDLAQEVLQHKREQFFQGAESSLEFFFG